MADIAHTIPAIVTVREGSSFGFTRPGLQQTAFISGRYLSRDWHGYDVREYDLDFTVLQNSTTALEQWSAFWHHIDGGNSEGYLVEPISETHRELICGGLGDAAKTTFPIPVVSPSSVTVFVNGVPQASSAYTLHTKANLLSSDSHAAPTAVGDTYSSSGDTETAETGFSLVGLGCVSITSAGGGSIYPLLRTAEPYAPATAGESYTAVAWCFNLSGTDLPFGARIYWYDSGGGALGSNTSAYTNINSGDGWSAFTYQYTAPASTASASVCLIRNNNVNTTKFAAGAFALNPGDYDRWHLPSQSPGLVEFATAPASGARITATATGQRLARCRFEPGSRWSMSSPGNATLRSVRAVEVVEF